MTTRPSADLPFKPERPVYAHAEIEAWLIAAIAAVANLPPSEIDPRASFESYGLSSREAVALSAELSDWLGRDLPPTLAWEYPSIDALARELAAGPTSDRAAEPAAYDPARPEPIAIIGIGLRFPGADSPAAFWRLLRDGVDAIREIPPDRPQLWAAYHDDPAQPGKMNTRWGGFLDGIDQFAPAFFGIAPREATRMDPQQRLLLEVAWEALEDAGQVPARLAGTPAGVFIGISTNDYGQLQFADPALNDPYAGTGNALSIAANRISYLFDFAGPSVALDTACSSSLVAVHLACESLRSGESTLALAGGVNLILHPGVTVNFTKAGAMAPDGRCKTFDARANGYVRGEGAAIVVLKRLSQAVADNDPIYAVILGSAVNQDGRTNGLMAPNPKRQEEVLRAAYARAGVAADQIQYVEAHGTGTLLGDPIEALALGNVLRLNRAPDDTCAIGSVKTNIGHLEAAAGVAGLIKVALSLQHRAIPPSLHFVEPNPHIPFDDLPLRVQTTLGPWPERDGPALAAVSAFGFGGTNAHAVLSSAPPVDGPRPAGQSAREPILLPLSARTADELELLADAYRAFLAPGGPGAAASLSDIAATASLRRSHHDERLAIVGISHDELIDGLNAYLAGEARRGMVSGRAVPNRRSKLAFVFSGHGSQWIGMGRELLEQEPVLRAAIEECDRALRGHTGWSLIELLRSDDPDALNRVEVAQPAIFAMQVALAALWRSWGILPDAVVGHSMGEVAAAHVAGALSLNDAALVISQRSQVMTRASGQGQGRTALIDLPADALQPWLAAGNGRVAIAAYNSPTSTVISGDTDEVELIVAAVERQGTFTRLVKADVAAHSAQMDPLLDELGAAVAGVRPRLPAVPIYSTVTGEPSQGRQFTGAYWVRNLREPVRFAEAVGRLIERGFDRFLEVSPHPVLVTALRQSLEQSKQPGNVLASLRNGQPERATMLASLGSLYTLGLPIEWGNLYPSRYSPVGLPTYRWQRARFWHGHGQQASQPVSGPDAVVVGTSGAAITVAGLSLRRLDTALPLWETAIGADQVDPTRIDHDQTLDDATLLDLVKASTGASQGVVLGGLSFAAPVTIPEHGQCVLQIAHTPESSGRTHFEVHSKLSGETRPSGGWTRHLTGWFTAEPDAHAPAAPTRSPARGRRQRAPRVDQLREVSPDEQITMLEAWFRDELALVIEGDPERIDVHQPLDTMGLDSLMALDFETQIERQLGITLSPTDLLLGPSLHQLATMVRDRLSSPDHVQPDAALARYVDAPANPAPIESGRDETPHLAQLSNEELDALIAKMLAEEENSA